MLDVQVADALTMDEVETIASIMANVDRLTEDAMLLIKYERMPSAFVLYLIALEEIGKVIHLRWRHLGLRTAKRGRTSHLQKQWAVACLLIANKLAPLCFTILQNPTDIHNLNRLAIIFWSSPEKAFFESVIASFLENSKQLGLYEDDRDARQGRDRADIDIYLVKKISDAMLTALPLMENKLLLILANKLYEDMPAYQSDILAEAAQL